MTISTTGEPLLALPYLVPDRELDAVPLDAKARQDGEVFYTVAGHSARQAERAGGTGKRIRARILALFRSLVAWLRDRMACRQSARPAPVLNVERVDWRDLEDLADQVKSMEPWQLRRFVRMALNDRDDMQLAELRQQVAALDIKMLEAEVVAAMTYEQHRALWLSGATDILPPAPCERHAPRSRVTVPATLLDNDKFTAIKDLRSAFLAEIDRRAPVREFGPDPASKEIVPLTPGAEPTA